MRVFVLTTGRSASMTFARAAAHATNFTAGHETHVGIVGPQRLAYPDQHIEVDNRLTWMLGPLHEAYPTDVHYVHLLRDREDVAASLERFWIRDPSPTGPSLRARAIRLRSEQHPRYRIMEAFAYGVLQRMEPWAETEKGDVARFFIDVVTANVEEFLRDKPHSVVEVASAQSDFRRFWTTLGCEGDLDAATAEWSIRHNAR